MDPVNYWLMAREYSIWNATIAPLQFWTAYPEAHILSSTIEQVYNACFYSTSTHMLCQQSDEALFSHFVTTLNATFKSKLTIEDEGHNSGSKNFNIPIPLRPTAMIHHVSSEEHVSFDPYPVMPCSRGIRELTCRPVCQCLTFSSLEEEEDDTPMDKTPSPPSTVPVQHHTDTFQQLPSKCTLHTYVTLGAEDEDMEEDFQTVPLDDEHWNMEETPNRTLCVHEHALPHGLCPYPCPMQTTKHHHTMTHWI